MDLHEFAENARKTYVDLGSRELNDAHMIFGMITEVGELADTLKKKLAYGKDLDTVNLIEELGDILWYWINFCTNYGFDPDVILDRVIGKLKIRYGDKFNVSGAINRNLEKERSFLEGYSPDETIMDDADNYDYVADDFNFDAARERAWR